MPEPLARWEPARDPVHRLLLTLDFQAGLTACHRWRPLDPAADGPGDPPAAEGCRPPPADPDAHPSVILRCELTAADADAAIARYVRLGRPEAAKTVRAITGLLMEVAAAYAARPCPCHRCPDCGKRPFADRSELVFSLVYSDARQALLHHLALAGEAIPRVVRMRGADLTQLLRADDIPPDPHALLRQVLEVVVAELGACQGVDGWPAAVAGWVDKLAGPAGTAARPTWRAGPERPVSPEEYAARVAARQAATGADLPPARLAILVALATAGEPLPGKKLAARAGYKPGSLRRHTKPMQDAGLIRLVSAGYELTPAGVTVAAAHTPVTYAVTSTAS